MASTSGTGSCLALLSAHDAGAEAAENSWTEFIKHNQSCVLLPNGQRKFGLNGNGPPMRSATTALRVPADKLPCVPIEEAESGRQGMITGYRLAIVLENMVHCCYKQIYYGVSGTSAALHGGVLPSIYVIVT